jgi:hypothetical protein
MKSVESVVKDAMRNAVLSCSKEYGFDSAEALMRLGMDSVTISVKGSKEKKAGVKKAAMPSIALPFTTCNPALCSGLKQNHGLYTQCPGAPVEDNSFCKGCIKQCEKNESGKPDNGTIEDRVKSDFKGPKGDAPKHYTAVMKKLKLTKEQVLEEAGKFGIEIDEEHFVAPATQTKRGRPSKKSADDNSASVESKKRGRPKKQPKDVKPEEVDDLFANLVSEAQAGEEDASETSSISGSETSTSTKSKKAKLTEAEKAEKKQMAEADKEAKKAAAEKAKEEKKAAADKVKEEKKAAADKEKADKKAVADKEKADKKAAADQLKAEKEAKKLEAEKEKAEKKAALEAKKAAKESKPVAEKESKPKAAKSAKKEEAAAAPAVLKVKKFEYKGTKYLKSSNGVVYNMEQDEVGTWNEESKEIDFKAVDDEEEEEEYESEEE